MVVRQNTTIDTRTQHSTNGWPCGAAVGTEESAPNRTGKAACERREGSYAANARRMGPQSDAAGCSVQSEA